MGPRPRAYRHVNHAVTAGLAEVPIDLREEMPGDLPADDPVRSTDHSA